MQKERFNEAILAHTHWKKRLKKAIEIGNSELSLSEVKDVRRCPLGQWLLSEESSELPQRLELKELHREFHEEAAVILGLAVRGEKTEATKRLALGSHFNQLTARIVNKLAELRDNLPPD